MRLIVDDIPERGRQVDVTQADAWAMEAARVALEGAPSAVEGFVRLQRRAREILVDGRISAAAERGCDRCGARLLLQVDGDLELTYLPALPEAEVDGRLTAADLDVGLYEAGELDLALVVQEHLALLVPYKLLCDSPETERTEPGEPCPASVEIVEERAPDPRFAALAQLKFD